MKNAVLIGFMGSGKSAVAEEIAKQRKVVVVDTDKAVEMMVGMPLATVFDRDGEKQFRTYENAILERYRFPENDVVVVTGAGMPLYKKNANTLKSIGTLIYLSETYETACERLKGDINRPMLNVQSPEEEIFKLLKFRAPKYERLADYTIETDGRSIESIAMEIIQIMEKN